MNSCYLLLLTAPVTYKHKILKMKCEDIDDLYISNEVGRNSTTFCLEIFTFIHHLNILKSLLDTLLPSGGYFWCQEMILIKIHKKKQPHKSLPTVKFFATGNDIINILICIEWCVWSSTVFYNHICANKCRCTCNI